MHISEITGIPLREDPRLIEQSFGIWEGTSPRSSTEFLRAKQNFINSFESGESMFRVAQRIYNLFEFSYFKNSALFSQREIVKR
jgi:probable phosphoglycerate mutase